ncbi:MAG: HAMP domain-containing sensor histidine kinase [Eubacteriales bacterium]|nr:HAMP domain-containing sensor histidine kinase [Eubacteriales bacterium]
MKLKEYSMRIRKNIAVLLHMIFLTLAVGSISFMYLNSQIGSGIFHLFDSSYEESDQFNQQFQTDLDLIFQYVAYRDVFETDGALDLSKNMFSVSSGDGPEIHYTLEEVLRYAKSQGFYLNDQFEVVNDLFIYDNASTNRDQMVHWRAYDPNRIIHEPGDAYSSLLDLSREVLDCLSAYYKVNYQMFSSPTNLYFVVAYLNDDETEAIFTNAEGMSTSQLKDLGSYCSLNSDSIFIETNLTEVPKNVARFMEQNNTYGADRYYMTAAVDTSYLADDHYAAEAAAYKLTRSRFAEAIAGLVIGILGCLATLYYLILVSGYSTIDRTVPYLHSFDTVTTESWVVLMGICTLFMLFLGEKIGYRLIHLVSRDTNWTFMERMLQAVIIYICCLAGGFGLLRRYKNRTLWTNSLLHHFQENLNLYLADRTFTHRLFCVYTAFVAVQLAAAALLAVLFHFRGYTAARAAALAIAAGLLLADYLMFHRLFSISVQDDQIADAISKIAGGDTGYQMDLSGLSGKELRVGRMINSIGTGLERALQEQVKSERLKADLITNVSHDLKTPLTSIINYVDLLKREKLPGDRVQEYIRVLDQKSQRLKNLTEDLVEASKASSGNVKLEMTNLDLVEMIWQTNGEFEEKFSTRSLELVANLPSESILIHADGRHLWRVLENVYNNAFKYAMEHSRVYTDIALRGDQVLFTIKNVSESPLNLQGTDLTERFVRGDVSRTTEGSGLGLSIAQSLTKLQGGTFDILIDGDLFKVQIGFKVVEKQKQ